MLLHLCKNNDFILRKFSTCIPICNEDGDIIQFNMSKVCYIICSGIFFSKTKGMLCYLNHDLKFKLTG